MSRRTLPFRCGVVPRAVAAALEDRLKTREAGFAAHLTKPADPTAIQELLARSGLVR